MLVQVWTVFWVLQYQIVKHAVHMFSVYTQGVNLTGEPVCCAVESAAA